MADKIAKLLARLPPKDLRLIRSLLERLASGDTQGLDIKAMKGHEHVFRARAGNYRVIFSLSQSHEVKIIAIARRNKKTYKDF